MNPGSSSGGNIRFKKFLPGIAWFFLIMVLICLPGQDLPSVDDWLSLIYFDKWVHAGLFGILCLLFTYPFLQAATGRTARLQAAIRVTIAVIIWGLTTEFIQKFFVTGRNFDLLDWAADSFGALLAFAIVKWRFIK